MECENILQLPNEILIIILSFIDDRFEVAQVCKIFYEVVCIIDKNKFWLSFGNEIGKVKLYIEFTKELTEF